MGNASDFVIENGVLKKYIGAGKNVVISDDVKKIGYKAFEGCSSLKTVTIPGSVMSVEANAFAECRKLEKVTISEGVTSIHWGAFSNCSKLTDVSLPDSLNHIGSGAFFGCKKLESLTIPESVTHIENNIVSETMIHIIDISRLPMPLRPNAAVGFAKSGGEKGKPGFESHSKYIKANALKLVDVALAVPDLLYMMCREKLISPKNVEIYVSAAQKSGNAEMIAMMLDYQANTVSTKQKEGFEKRKEQEQDQVVERILSRAGKAGIEGLSFALTGRLEIFCNRDELKSVIQDKGGKLASSISAKVDYLIMNDRSNENSTAQKAKKMGIEVITEYRFLEIAGPAFIMSGMKLAGYRGLEKEVIIPENVKSIGEKAFENCNNITRVTIPYNVTSIEESAFKGCSNLLCITIPEGVNSIGKGAFEDCKSLTELTIPASVTSIGDTAFKGCSSLSGVILPDGLKTIGDGAFEDCGSLTSLKVPGNVTNIGSAFLRGCGKLTEISVSTRNNRFNSDEGVLFKKQGKVLFQYPCGKAGNYIIPNSVTRINYKAFCSSKELINVSIPNGVVSIDLEAFRDCSKLKSVTIPNSVTTIGYEAFRDCRRLESLTIPDSVKIIGHYAFRECAGLTSVTIPGSVTAVEDGVFFDCRHLTEVTILEGVTEIGRFAFKGCDNLLSVTIPESVTTICSEHFYAPFSGCRRLVIHAPGGSYAEQYAKENNISFVAE